MKTKSFLALLAILWTTTASLFAATANVAPRGTAYSDNPLYGGADIAKLIDTDRSSVFHGDTAIPPGFAYSVDLGKNYEISELRIYPRQDGCCAERLANFRVSLHSDIGGVIGAEIWGQDLFTNGTGPATTNGAVVKIALPSVQNARWIQIRSLAAVVPDYALQMTELEVIATVPPEEVNRALGTLATSNRPLFGGTSASLLVDGNRMNYAHGNEVIAPGFAYEINLGTTVTISKMDIYARQDGCCPERLSNYRVSVHSDNNGAIGSKVWSADLHTDLSDPGSGPGAKDSIEASLDPAGTFKGQWIRIESLDGDPVFNYALQIGEVEVFGLPEGGASVLISSEPVDRLAGPTQSVTFVVGATAVNGDSSLLKFQWQRNGVDIPGATNATYVIASVANSDLGKNYQCVISYPGLPDVKSRAAKLNLNLAYKAIAFSNRPLWAGGGWTIDKLVNGDRGDAFHGDQEIAPGFAYEVNLGANAKLERIDIFPRQDGCCPERLSNFRVSVHKDNNGVIGESVWSADFYTDGTNPGSGSGSIVHVTADLNAAGVFEGQWIRILSLEDPVTSYALQMTEMEVVGAFTTAGPVLSITQDPRDGRSVPGRTITYSVEAKVLNGEFSQITYQWQKNGVDIAGATAASYTTPPLTSVDAGARYRCVVSFPGVPSVTSAEASFTFDSNYARGAKAYTNRDLWASIWNISQIVDGSYNDVLHGAATIETGFAYEIDLEFPVVIDEIIIYGRQDGCCPERLTNYRVSVHADNGGKIGDLVWSADLHTDGSNTGELEGKKDVLTASLDPQGKFAGQWIRILSLEDPVQSYALQMAEVEVLGKATLPPARPAITITRSGANITLAWTEGILQSANTVNGPWEDVSNSASPFNIDVQGTMKFYRLKR